MEPQGSMTHLQELFNNKSWAESTQFLILILRFILILPYYLRLGIPKGFLPLGLLKFWKHYLLLFCLNDLSILIF